MPLHLHYDLTTVEAQDLLKPHNHSSIDAEGKRLQQSIKGPTGSNNIE